MTPDIDKLYNGNFSKFKGAAIQILIFLIFPNIRKSLIAYPRCIQRKGFLIYVKFHFMTEFLPGLPASEGLMLIREP